MNILDCIVLALSILAVFAVGVLSGRRSRASASEGEFLMANKSLNKLQTGFSTAATDFGGSGMVGAIGYCYVVGMSGIWWNLTAAPAFLVVGFLFAKAFNRMDSATLPDYLGKRYSPAVKLLASVMHICSNVALLSSQFTIACAVLYTITGFSMTFCLIICLLLVICLTSGGLRSVVNTDAVLFVIIVTSLVVAVPIVLHAGGGLGSIAARLPDGETGKIHQPEVAAPQQDQPTHQEQQGFTPKADIVSGVASVLGAFGGLLGGGASGGDEPQDTARQKRKKKKKRTRHID